MERTRRRRKSTVNGVVAVNGAGVVADGSGAGAVVDGVPGGSEPASENATVVGGDYHVEFIPIEDLTPYEKNAKKHPKEQIERIKASIREFGFRQNLVVDENNVVVIGHGRLQAAKELGTFKTLPCIRANDLTPDQIKALRLADNKVAESDWDEDFLNFELGTINLDMSQFGFNFSKDEEEANVAEDEIPGIVEERCHPGDMWQLGEHKLFCGDITDPATIRKLIDGVQVDMIFTDPPYGYQYQSNQRTKSKKFDVLQNDNAILDFFKAVKGVCRGFVYVCTAWKTADKWIELFKKYYELTNVIIWDKGGGGIGDLFHTFSTDYEMILVCNNGQELRGKRYGSVWNFSETEISKMKKEELLKIVLEQKEYGSVWKEKKDNPNEYVHPTQKPVALSARAIRSSTDFCDIVLDVFGGSGSTLIACEQLNRKCYMVELDPHYCDVIIQRYVNFKGSDKDVYLIDGI